jgi:hypothetical protein
MSENDAVLIVESRLALRDGRAQALCAGLSHAEIGRACKVTPQAVTRWLKCERVPRGEGAVRFARLLARLGLEVPGRAA